MKHFQRKNVCEYTENDISVEKCKEKLEKGLLKINKYKIKISHECEYCNQNFDRIDRLNKHIIKCKEKDKLFDIVKKQQDIVKIQQEEIEKLKNQMCNNKGGNTTNNNTVNNYGDTYNINISSFKDTNYMALKDEIMSCLENQDPQLKVPAFEKIIDKIHFNKDYPENHNIYKPNVRDDRIMTYNGDDFIIEKTAVDTILEKLEQILDQCIDKDKGKEYIKKLKHHLKLKSDDLEYTEATKDDIAVSLYNGKNIVKSTHKDLKKQENKIY
jgi:hypothetical protein